MQRIARERATRASTPLLVALLLVTGTAYAQPVGEGSGPLSEVSRPLSEDSGPVHERGRTLSDHSVGSMRSGPVRGGRRASMLSGPVSDVSVGPVTAGQSMTGGGSVSENSEGAVKNDLDPSFGEQVYDLQRALAPLQQRLRQQADEEAAALEQMEVDEDGDAALDAGSALANEVAYPDAGEAAVGEKPNGMLDDGTEAGTAPSVDGVDQPTPGAEDAILE